jgi:hypothetical protein
MAAPSPTGLGGTVILTSMRLFVLYAMQVAGQAPRLMVIVAEFLRLLLM